MEMMLRIYLAVDTLSLEDGATSWSAASVDGNDLETHNCTVCWLSATVVKVRL